MTRFARTVLVALAWMSLVGVACNLTATQEPPTIAPNPNVMPGVTPPPTLGYATLAPGEAPQQNTGANPQIDVQMFNLLNEVETTRLMEHIRNLEEFGTRHVNSIQTDATRGVGAASKYLEEQLTLIQNSQPQHFSTFSQTFTAEFDGVRSTQKNIIGVLHGTESGAGTIIIGAHYDSRTYDLTDAIGPAPGANDNGSGVAAVLELARILSKYPQRATIMFVLFAAEEVGRQGSTAFARDYIAARNIDVIAMLNVDTIGSWNGPDGTIIDDRIRLFTDEDATFASPHQHLGRMVEFIGYNHELSLDITVIAQKDRDGRYGDHFSFQAFGYPSVRFIEAIEDTPNREGDDYRNHVEPEYLRKSTQTILGVVWSLGGGLRPPRSVSMRETGTVFVNTDTSRQFPNYQLIWDEVPGAVGYVVALRPPGALTYTNQYTVNTNETVWHQFPNYTAVAIAAIDANGLVGPLSREYVINTP